MLRANSTKKMMCSLVTHATLTVMAWTRFQTGWKWVFHPSQLMPGGSPFPAATVVFFHPQKGDELCLIVMRPSHRTALALALHKKTWVWPFHFLLIKIKSCHRKYESNKTHMVTHALSVQLTVLLWDCRRWASSREIWCGFDCLCPDGSFWGYTTHWGRYKQNSEVAPI